MVHVAATRFQGIPSGVALGTNSPDNGYDLTYTSSSKGCWYEWGSVIYTRVAWATASTGSQLFRSLYGVIDLNLFIPRHCSLTVHTPSLIQLFITGGDLNHTSVPGAASAWAAGTLLQSDYGGAFWRRVSLKKALSAAGWWSQSPQSWAAGPDVQQRLLLEGRCLWRRWYPGVGRAAAADTQFLSSPSLSCRTSHKWPSRPSREGFGVGLQVRGVRRGLNLSYSLGRV